MQDALKSEREESLKRALLAASPRSAPQGDGAGQGGEPPIPRRRVFVDKLTLAMEELYEVRGRAKLRA